MEKIITDENLREIAIHGSKDFPIQYYQDDITKFQNQIIGCHWHNEFEFAVIKSGTLYCVIGNEKIKLSQGEGIFINSKIIHGFESNEDCVMPNIVFSPSLISEGSAAIYRKFVMPIIESQISYVHLTKNNDWQEQVLKTLNEIFEMFNSETNTKELDIQIAIGIIWRALFINRDSLTLLPKAESFMLTQSRIRTMMEFIYENYADKICLSDIAASAKISKSEALRCFKSGAGTSPINYLIQYRLIKAKDMLMSTENTITNIAAAVGFENTGYFDRMFKKTFGITPKETRIFRKHQKKQYNMN